MAILRVKDANGNLYDITAIQGERGPAGPQGVQGERGETGPAATPIVFEVTVGNGGWHQDWETENMGLWYRDVSVPGLLASDNPVVDVKTAASTVDINSGVDVPSTQAYIDAFSKIVCIVTYANKIRLWASAYPVISFPILLKVVR